MKHLILFTIIALLVLGCRKEDKPKPPPADKFGEVLIVISDDVDFMTSVTIDSTEFSPMQTRIADCADADNSTKKIKLKTGTYEVQARNGLVSWNRTVTVTENECKIVDLNSSNSTGEKRGSVSFYTEESGMRKINVLLDGRLLGTLGDVHKAPSPTGFIGVPVVSILRPGTYNYQVKSENGHNWEGVVTIMNGKTTFLTVGRFNAKPIDVNETNLTFYNPTNNAAGSDLDVYVNGELVGRTLSNYDPATPDLCIAKFTVSVIKPKGTFSYTASSPGGKSWSGVVTAAGAGDCQLIKIE